MKETLAGRGGVRQFLKPAFGYLFAGACLIWVFHDVQMGQMLAHVASVKWDWIALAVVFDVLSYICQGWRWQLLLQPLGRISVRETTEAIYVGLFTNEVTPLRFGEIVRGYFVSRKLSSPLISVIPSMAVERLFDGLWVAAAFGLTAIFVPLPRDLLDAGDMVGITVLVGTAVFAYAVFRTRNAGSTEEKPARGGVAKMVFGFASSMTEGLRRIGFSRVFFVSFGVSFFVLFFQAVAFWLVMWGYGLQRSFWVGAAVLLIVHLGTAIPNAPANVGTYQFFTVVGLSLFGVEKTYATGFSVVVFVILTLPLWAIGLWALTRSGLTLGDIRKEIQMLRAREAPEAPDMKPLSETST